MSDEATIQVKAVHKDGIFFDEQQRPIQVTWPELPPAPEEEVLNALLESGIVIPNLKQATEVVSGVMDDAIEESAERRAAEIIVHIFHLLPQNRHGDELRAAFLGIDETTRAMAARHGVSHVAIWKAIKKLKTRMFGPGG